MWPCAAETQAMAQGRPQPPQQQLSPVEAAGEEGAAVAVAAVAGAGEVPPSPALPLPGIDSEDHPPLHAMFGRA